LAHELGHNLNFDHDFYDDDKTKPQQPRFDSKKRPCTGIGSIMDYAKGGQGDKRQWSTCSVEDMQEMIDEFPTCLKVIDPSNPPTEIGDQPITSHECNLNKVKPGLNGYDISNLNGKKFCPAIFSALHPQPQNFALSPSRRKNILMLS
jgi:hypothetical protein